MGDQQRVTTSEAARVLQVSEATVRSLERAGKLPAEKTLGGLRLFRPSDVARVAEERAQQRKERHG